MLRATAVMLGVGACAAACAENLDRYELVKDLRVLAIQAEPPEVLRDLQVPSLDVIPPDPVHVSFRALVVDPRGGAVSYAWSFCPVESDQACLDYDARRDEAPARFRLDLDAMRALGSSGTALPVNDTQSPPPDLWWATRAAWPYTVAPLELEAPSRLFDFMRDDNGFGAGMGAWPSVILGLTKGAENLTVQKRFVVGLRDLTPIANMFGYTVCPTGQTPADVPDCVPIRAREPNHNPVFSRIEMAPGESRVGAVFSPLDFDPVEQVAGNASIAAGSFVRIRPVFTDESYEPYQSLKADIETARVFVEDKQEEISVSWFLSAGKVKDTLTWRLFTKGLDTAYEAPDAPPSSAGGRVTLWLVARDQRGGESWASVELDVTP